MRRTRFWLPLESWLILRPGPIPLTPILVPKLWGGDTLARMFGPSRLTSPEPIGESWQLASLPGADSRVSAGPFVGRALGDLFAAQPDALLGDARPAHGRFPLLVKLLDAAQRLSVQTHPRPRDDRPPDGEVKHEAWVILRADPGAQVFIGLRDNVTREHLTAALGSRAVLDLLVAHDARVGDCYYLPSGVPHSLSAGVVVYEAQTPSEVTYRLYDWDRVGPDGKPRPLHLEQALANTRFDLDPHTIRPAARVVDPSETVLCQCPPFILSRLSLAPGAQTRRLPLNKPHVWTAIAGAGRIDSPDFQPAHEFRAGDTILLPAALDAVALRIDEPLAILQAAPT